MTKKLLARAKCHLLGCYLDETPCCDRCGTDLYDIDFIQRGWLTPIIDLYWRVRRAIRRQFPRHCQVCGKKYWRGPKIVGEYVCSDECHDEWLPF